MFKLGRVEVQRSVYAVPPDYEPVKIARNAFLRHFTGVSHPYIVSAGRYRRCQSLLNLEVSYGLDARTHFVNIAAHLEPPKSAV